MTDLEEEIMRGLGKTTEQARLYAQCCAAQEHYTALRRQGADPCLVAQAKQRWDDAAWAYAQSERS
jgi:hypothetical protein